MSLSIGNYAQKKTPSACADGVEMVEAAGQLIHLFRDGLDYAFILHAGCGACYPSVVLDES